MKQEPMLMEAALTKRVYVVTRYKDNGDGTFTAREKFDATEQFDRLAEQRRGTCKWILEHSGPLYDKWRCSECGYMHVESRCDAGATDFDPKFCPDCGRRVER